MGKALFWFRNDLRVKDNVALKKSMDECEEVFPVYCFDPRHFELSHSGYAKSGSFRTSFLLESVAVLRQNLRDRGSELIIRLGKPEDHIIALTRSLNGTCVYCSKEVTSEEVIVEDAMERALWRAGVSFMPVWQSTLYHVEDLPWPINRLPDVFTAFRKDVEKEMKVRPTVESLKFITKPDVDSGDLPSLSDLGMVRLEPDPRRAFPFEGGENVANARLKSYLWETDLIQTYKKTRNEMIGSAYSSKLSPYLALGCISPRTIYEEVKRYEKERFSNNSTYWLIFEILWRDYFRFVAKKHGNRIFQLQGIKQVETNLKQNTAAFQKWCLGNTKEAIVDANMRELNATGFMSNRGRQITASYLINDLKQDWTWGASYFESRLIDYDPCSNWGNWCYIAGVGNDPRKDRYFNPKTQTERYDPDGAYIRLWSN